MGGKLFLYKSDEQGSIFKFHVEAAANSKELMPALKLPLNNEICVFTDSDILRSWFFSELNQPHFKAIADLQETSLKLDSFSYILVDSDASDSDLIRVFDQIESKQQQIIFFSWVGQSLPVELKKQVKLLRKPMLISALAEVLNDENQQ